MGNLSPKKWTHYSTSIKATPQLIGSKGTTNQLLILKSPPKSKHPINITTPVLFYGAPFPTKSWKMATGIGVLFGKIDGFPW